MPSNSEEQTLLTDDSRSGASAPRRPRRWVDDEIAQLDPATDYAKIMSLVAEHQMDEFSLNFMVTLLNSYVIKPAHMAETQVFTNKAIRRPNQRMQDALNFFWTWYVFGPSSPEAIESVNRLNKIHAGVASHLPGHFNDSEDFHYVLGRLVVVQDRLLKKVGLRGMDPRVKLAQFNFARELSTHFRREGNRELESFPDSLEALEAFVDQWEGKNHEYSPIQADLVWALIYTFAERWFPRPLHPLGRWIAVYALEDDFLEHIRIPLLRGVRRLISHGLLKTLLFYKNRLAADAAVSSYTLRKTLTRDEYKAMDAVAVARADEKGWYRGGKGAVGLRERAGGGCPMMSHVPSTETPAESADKQGPQMPVNADAARGR